MNMAISAPTQRTALEVLAANTVETFIQPDDGVTPTPVISRAIIRARPWWTVEAMTRRLRVRDQNDRRHDGAPALPSDDARLDSEARADKLGSELLAACGIPPGQTADMLCDVLSRDGPSALQHTPTAGHRRFPRAKRYSRLAVAMPADFSISSGLHSPRRGRILACGLSFHGRQRYTLRLIDTDGSFVASIGFRASTSVSIGF